MHKLRATLRELYHGSSQRGIRYRSVILVFDALIIAFFIVSPFFKESQSFLMIEYAIGALLGIDLLLRAWAYPSLIRWIARPIVWIDLVVLASLLLPLWLANFAFLRVMRATSLVNSEAFWQIVANGRWRDTPTADVVKAICNLGVFVFVVTGFVHSSFAARTPGIDSYLDSMYFTVSSLTTTGYGDVTLPGAWGKIVSMLVMVVGVSLFVRLVQLLLRPTKVIFPCPGCGMRRHDPDAIHCKGCGVQLAIPHDNE